MTVAPWTTPIPDEFLKEPSVAEWARQATLYFDALSAPGGVLSTSEDTTETVLTHSEKLDLMTITQTVNLDDMESKINAVSTGSPEYTVTNDATDRTLDANDAAGAISVSPTQAQVENIRDAQLAQADTLATLIRDLATKGVIG